MSWIATDIPSNLNLIENNSGINMLWQNNALISTGYRIRNNNVIIATLGVNSTILYSTIASTGVNTSSLPMSLGNDIASYKEWTYNIDKTVFTSLSSIGLVDGNLPDITTVDNGKPTAIIALNEIALANIKNLKSINYIPSITGTGIALMMFSIDNGITWMSFNTTTNLWQVVNINNKSDIKAKANNKDVINTLTSTQLELLRTTSTSIKIAYYLELSNISDEYLNDKITISFIDNSSNEIDIVKIYNSCTGNSTSYIDISPLGNQTNNYSVCAYDVINGETGLLTGSILTRPSLVTGIVGTPSGYNTNLNWTSQLCDGYHIYNNLGTLIQTVTTNTYLLINTVEKAATIFITAYNVSGESFIKEPYIYATIPNAPSNLIVSQLPNGLSLAWTNNSLIQTGFNIQKRKNGGIWQNTTTLAGITYQDIFVPTVDALYEYQINAYNASGISAYTTWGIRTVDSVILSGVLNDISNTITYTWNSSVGCTGYKLSLTDNLTNVVTVIDSITNTYVFNIIAETSQKATILAYITDTTYGQFNSSTSNEVDSVSSSKNTVSNITYDYDVISNKINIHFEDKSLVEDGFKIKYSQDGQAYQYISVLTTSKSTINTFYTSSIDISSILTSFVFSICAYNLIGASVYTTEISLTKTNLNKLQIGYISNNVKLGWIDNNINQTNFRVFYKIGSNTIQSKDVTTAVKFGLDNIYTTSIPMDLTSTINTFISYIDSNGQVELPSQILTTSYATYSKLAVASDFRVFWSSIGIAEYSWTINSNEIEGSKLIYQINNGSITTIDLPCGVNSLNKVITQNFTLLNNLDKISANVIFYNLIDETVQSDQLSLIYAKADTSPLNNFYKSNVNNNYLFTWDAKDYVANYEVHCTLNGIENSIIVLDNSYTLSFNYNNITSVSVYVIANFTSLEHTLPSAIISFTPTILNQAFQTYIYNTINTNYLINTKILTLATKIYLPDSEVIKTLNVIDKIAPIETEFISYYTTSSSNYADINYTITTLNNNINTLIVTYGTKYIALLNRSFITCNVTDTNILCTISMIAGIKTNYIDNEIITNIVSNYFLVCASIIDINLTQSINILKTISYTHTVSNNFPISYMIWTLCKFIAILQTDIHPILVACLGDSITAGHPGYWNESHTGNVESQYEYWLQKRVSSDYIILNEGRGSDTTSDMVNRFALNVLDNSPQYCIFLGGVNDISWASIRNHNDQPTLDTAIQLIKDNIINMINQCFANGITPIWGTLIPWNAGTGIYRIGLLNLNTYIKDYCNGTNGLYCADFYNAGKDDMPPMPLEDPTAVGMMNPLYDGDSKFDVYGNLISRGYGVHPSPTGYKIMAEKVSLGIFKSLVTGIKIYLDAQCLVEENKDGNTIYNPLYNIAFSNLDRGRTKTIIRYVKNIGTIPIIFSIYNNSEMGVTVTYSLDNITFKDSINNQLSSGCSCSIFIQVVVPQIGILPTVTTTLATRSFKVL